VKDHLLVFIPGIMGTELVYRGPGEFKEEITEVVWGEDASALWSTLTAAPQRLRLTTDLIVGRVLGKIHALHMTLDVYAPFLSFVTKKLGYKEHEDFFAFGYDWRQSNRKTAAQLAELLTRKLKEGFQTIKIVAHSMGGIVARLLLASPEYKDLAAKVSCFVQIGTPVRGASKAYFTLKRKPQFGGICDFVLSIASHVAPETHHLLLMTLNSFPSLFELLPHETERILVTAGGDFYCALDNRAWPFLNSTELRAHAETHAMIRTVQTTFMKSIYSTDLITDSIYMVDQDLVDVRQALALLGDGTVLASSASLGTAPGNCHAIRNRVEHQDLPNDKEVWGILTKEL
jgi:pimeloyl-ACP methyl ester carboxylesterase